ncbi:hypothetical protein NQ314_016625 [Rhamnusium bicolor]|uniref:Uncharacterized protein n=1 Tax=Rhamnusium bicolor TaxID=1586634 RepID=A0AAV8WV80_9CUCU|nr:hypothetical protein NQ314_016625 [Rhamnusium bicolor]
MSLRIMTRYDGNSPQENNCNNNCDNNQVEESSEDPAQTILETVPEPTPAVAALPEAVLNTNNNNKDENTGMCTTNIPENTPVSSSDLTAGFPLKERNFLPKTRESTSFDPREPLARPSVGLDNGKENLTASPSSEDNIQCNEISSSNIEVDSTCDEEGGWIP